MIYSIFLYDYSFTHEGSSGANFEIENVSGSSHSWGFLVRPLRKGMELFPKPFGSLRTVFYHLSWGLISLYEIPKICICNTFLGDFMKWNTILQKSNLFQFSCPYFYEKVYAGNRTRVRQIRRPMLNRCAIEALLREAGFFAYLYLMLSLESIFRLRAPVGSLKIL